MFVDFLLSDDAAKEGAQFHTTFGNSATAHSVLLFF